MCIYVVGALFLGSLLTIVVILSRQSGMLSEQVKALKEQAKEQARANKIMDSVRNMSNSDVRERLQNLSGKQQ